MNTTIVEPFSTAALNVLPQLGFEVSLGDIIECDRKLDVPGVIVVIGITGGLHGNVIFAMNEDCAKMIASTMMMGMPIEQFDDMAQSAVSELSNMLAANTCIELSGKGVTADISTPTLMYGQFTATASFDHVTRVELQINGFPYYIYVSLESKE